MIADSDTLVIGGTGLLGKEIISGERFNYTYFQTNPLGDERAEYLDLSDLENTKHLLEKANPGTIILTSAIVNADTCEENPKLAYKINARPLYLITDYLGKSKNDSFLLFVSSDYVFDGKKGNYKEEDEKNPLSVYGKMKSLAENIIFSSGIKYAVVRTSVIFGSEDGSGKMNFFLWLYENMKNNVPINVVTDQTVSPTLNINLATCIKEIVSKRIQGIFNIAGKDALTRFEMATIVKNYFNLHGIITPSSIKKIPWKAPRPENSSLNVEKAECTLTNKPNTFQESLRLIQLRWDDNNATRN